MESGIKDITIEEYHACKEWVSSSALKKVKRCLKDFKYYQDGYYDTEKKRHFDFGNAFELALLNPDGFDSKVANEQDVFCEILEENPDVKNIRNTTHYKDWAKEARANGKYILSPTGSESFETIQKMLKSCYQDAVIKKLILDIDLQPSLFWEDPVTGMKLKARPDIYKPKKGIIIDVKTTVDGSPEKFFKDVAKFDYPLQATMQIEGIDQCGLGKVKNYFWLVVEKTAPFSAQVYEFDISDREWIKDEYNLLIEKTSKAINEGKYPSYTDRSTNKYGIITAVIPSWYKLYIVS